MNDILNYKKNIKFDYRSDNYIAQKKYQNTKQLDVCELHLLLIRTSKELNNKIKYLIDASMVKGVRQYKIYITHMCGKNVKYLLVEGRDEMLNLDMEKILTLTFKWFLSFKNLKSLIKILYDDYKISKFRKNNGM